MILEGYGKPIYDFSTADEVLFAFRDAIAGHRNSWNANILHRDISANNILIGLPCSVEGWRGVIIDLDMAIWLTRTTSLAEADFRTGTRAFQSVSVLMSILSQSPRLCHDHLDDLESFFYVLCRICFGFSGPGKKLNPFPKTLSKWKSTDPELAADAKKGVFYLGLENTGETTPFFGDIFQELLEDFHGFFQAHVARKFSISKRGHVPSLPDLIPESSQHYETVLGFVDNAIRKRAALLQNLVDADAIQVTAAPTTSTSPPSTPPRTTSHSFPPRTPLNERLTNVPGSRTIRKRNSDLASLEEESPSKSKRQRQLQLQHPHASLRPSSLSLEGDSD